MKAVYDSVEISISLNTVNRAYFFANLPARIRNTYTVETKRQDSGLATLESFDILFANNYVERCKYGVRLSLGAGDNVVFGNTFSDLTRLGIV